MENQTRDFAGRVAIVTGAATGIGKEIAASFLRRGASGVVIADINLPMAKSAAGAGNSG